jgi:hypothetical protein
MAVVKQLNPDDDYGEPATDIPGENVTEEQIDLPTGIRSAARYICLYTTQIPGKEPVLLVWETQGIFESWEQAFASILPLVGVTGIRIVKVILPIYALPQDETGKIAL